MKKLTNQEIQEIRTFVINNGAKYYEVIEELTDHIANGIEEQWLLDNTLSFKVALDLEYNKFGILKFQSIQEDREQRKFKAYKHIFFLNLKEFFTFPLLVTTTAISLLSTLVLYNLGELLRSLAGIIMLTPILFYFIINTVDLIKYKRKNSTKLILDKVYRSTVSLPIVTASLLFQFLIIQPNIANWVISISKFWYSGIIGIGLTVSFISVYIALKKIKPIYEEERKKILRTV